MENFEIQRMSDDIREIKQRAEEISNEGNGMYVLLRDRMDSLELTLLKVTELLTEINNKLPNNCTFPEGIGLKPSDSEGKDNPFMGV